MKIVQKTTWIKYLTIGLFINISMLNVSCNKIREYAQFGDFYFVNQTDYNIIYQKGLEKFNVMANSSILIRDTQDAIKEVSPNRYHTLFINYNPPLIIKFNDNKCLEFAPNSEHTLLDIKNYVAEKIGKRTYKFTYTFTEADYNRAVACP